MKKYVYTTLLLLLCLTVFNAQAQRDSGDIKTYKVAIFAPLYLDSVFSGFKYKYQKSIPKFVMPGLDFVNGAQIALDTIPKEGARIEAFIYDTKSTLHSITWLNNNHKFDSLDLIIGSVKDTEFKQLADIAAKKKVPFVSATFPNDGGVTKNPYMVIMNSTLKAHCEGIFAYLLQNYGTHKILLCRKRGSQEDKIANYFRAANTKDGKSLLNIQTLFFDSVITPGLLKNRIDTSKETIIIGGSLDETFARNLASATFALNKTNPIVLIGMPNWDGFSFFTRKDSYKDFPIHFTSPYYNTKTDRYSSVLSSLYSRKYKTRPSDMAYKGFESVYLFTRLLMKHGKDMMDNLNDRSARVINDYTFKPVNAAKIDRADYVENKHLYILKLVNGSLMRAW
jgi:ABC-type branched-subunit amino acid transport system substrate-binding protein